MSIRIDVTETDYFLPEDGPAAEAAFLELLAKPGEAWVSAFGFTLQPLFDEILAADAKGVPIHLLLDHSQAMGHAEAPKVKALAEGLHHGDLTVTTAGINSGAPRQIYHWKGMVVAAADGGEPFCWEGSVNFSGSGWMQGNSARLFRSEAWAAVFVANFTAHRDWARRFEAQFQLGGS
jgi:hypothetical protein